MTSDDVDLIVQREADAVPDAGSSSVAGRRGAVRWARANELTGERLVIAAYVASQFIDVTFFAVGGFVVSAQKALVLVLLPIGALMLRRIVIAPQLVALAALAALAFSLSDLVSGRVNPTLAGAVVSIVLNCVAAVVLTSALTSGGFEPLRFFAGAWIVLSITTAVLALGQMFGVLPLVADAASNVDARETGTGLVRGTGLKNDPNFTAMLLLVGLVLCFYTWRRYARLLGVLVILVGIAATLSRMGVLIACTVLVLGAAPTVSLRRSPGRKIASVGAAALSVVLVAVALFLVSPGPVRQYMAERIDDLRATYQTLVLGVEPALAPGQVNIGSGVERADLNQAALHVFLDHWAVGVGANEVPAAVGRLTGMPAPAHNTYLETAAVGGLVGLALLSYYVASVVSLLAAGFRRYRKVLTFEQQTLQRSIRLVIVVIASLAAVLTLDYIAFFWLPMCLAIGIGTAREEPDASVESAVT